MQPHVTLTALSAQDSQAIEQWREIPGSNGRYEVSDHGRVRSYRYHKKWHIDPLYNRHYICKIGYVYYRLRIDGADRNHAAHRLVMLAFVGPSDLDVNHKDGDKQNNCLDNLEYMTALENTRHAIEVLGLRLGRTPGHAVETERDREIRQLAASGISQHEIARRYKISQPYVGYIVRRLIRPPAE